MRRIGGNIVADFQTLAVVRNELGEEVKGWETIATKRGFLDLSNSNANHQYANAKTIESTHVFICDRFDIDTSSVSRLVIGGRTFDVTYFDEPMALGYHFEIFLKETEQHGN